MKNSSVFHNFKAIFALPKWVRIFLAVLSVIALLGLGFGTALHLGEG